MSSLILTLRAQLIYFWRVEYLTEKEIDIWPEIAREFQILSSSFELIYEKDKIQNSIKSIPIPIRSKKINYLSKIKKIYFINNRIF